LRLEAIVQRKGDAAAKAYPSARILRSVEEALGDAAVQLVVVGTPNETHFALAKQALLAGKHVVIDKPFAATSAEAGELKELAEKQGVVLAPFHNRRWDGDFLTVRRLLAEEAVGRLVTYESHFDRFRPLPREDTWKEGANSANGLLMDLGPHLVDQALALFGAPMGITASVRKDRDKTDIEDAFDITLEYPGYSGEHGLRAHCRSSMLACDAAPRFLLHGTKGSFKKYGLDPQEAALVGGAKVPRMGEGEWLAEPESQWGTLTVAPLLADPGTLTGTKVKTELGDYRLYYANVRDAINGVAKLAVTPEEGYRTVRLLEMARESSAAGRTLKVEF
jgi:predicted dehydrogenase